MRTPKNFIRVSSIAATLLLTLALLPGCTGDDGGDAKTDGGASDAGQIGDAGPPCEEAKDCPDTGSPCIVAECVDKVCHPLESGDGAPCDDGDACTDKDTCQKGQCEPGASICQCKTNADCAAFGDGDKCNGSLICDVSVGKCVLDATTVVTCDVGKDTVCAKNTCDPKTGQCGYVPTKDGTACDDEFVCTLGDACKAGKCEPGKDACTCKSAADCPSPANACLGTKYCDKTSMPWACKTNPGTVIKCPSAQDTQCRKAACNPKTLKCELDAVAPNTPCEWDGNACTLDICEDGECSQGKLSTAKECECSVNADCAKHGDGDLCTGTLYCNKSTKACTLNPATVVNCHEADDTACASNTCDPKTGDCELKNVKNGTKCADGVPCTADEACQGGTCTAVKLSCTCTTTADCADQDDGNVCNGTLYCDKAKGKCVTNPATILRCGEPEKLACTRPGCDSKLGKCVDVPVADGSVCESDGTSCTGTDTCTAGKCVAGPNHCPCMADNGCAKHEDGNACNGTLFCDKAKKVCVLNPLDGRELQGRHGLQAGVLRSEDRQVRREHRARRRRLRWRRLRLHQGHLQGRRVQGRPQRLPVRREHRLHRL